MWRKRRGCLGGGNLGRRKGVSGIWVVGYVWEESQGVFVGTRLVGMACGSSWLAADGIDCVREDQ